MSSRIEKLATAYKESKPDIATSSILKRVQLESALAEDRTNVDIGRFSTGLDLVQSTAQFANELSEQKRLTQRAGKEFGILDILVGDEEALAAVELGAALEEEGTVIMDGIKIKAPSIYEEDALATNRQIKEFRDKTTKATEKALGITGELASSLKETGLTDEELGGSGYTDKEIQSMGLKQKSSFQNLLEMFRE